MTSRWWAQSMTGAWSSLHDWLACLAGWAYDWQTLITGVLAILAALIAARPVWRQLTILQLQSEAAARETLIMRVAAINSRRETTRREVQHITDEFIAYSRDDETPVEEDLNSEAAMSLEAVVRAVTSILISHQETSFDGEMIDTARKAAIQRAKALEACLNAIHTPNSIDDYYLTRDQVAELVEASERARKHLQSRISALGKSAEELDTAFEASLEQLRMRIRRIDMLLLGTPTV